MITFISPEKYHIIECGYSIQCKPNIPQQLYDHLDVNAEVIKNPFKQLVKYSFTVLDTLKNLPVSEFNCPLFCCSDTILLIGKMERGQKAVVSDGDENDNDYEDIEVKGFLQDFFLNM